MFKKNFLFVFLLSMLMAFNVFGQASAWINQGTTDNSDAFYQVITHSGWITTTGTLISNEFYPKQFSPYYSVYALSLKDVDSVKIRIDLQALGADNTWTTIRTVGVDSVQTHKFWNDTLQYKNNRYRYLLTGLAVASGGTKANGFRDTLVLRTVFKRE